MPYNCTWFQKFFEAPHFFIPAGLGSPAAWSGDSPEEACSDLGDALEPSSRGSVNSSEPARFLPSLIPLALSWRALASALQETLWCWQSSSLITPAGTFWHSWLQPGWSPPRHPRPFCLLPFRFARPSSAEASLGSDKHLCEGFVIVSARSSRRLPRSIRPKSLHAWARPQGWGTLPPCERASQHSSIFRLLNGAFVRRISWASPTWRGVWKTVGKKWSKLPGDRGCCSYWWNFLWVWVLRWISRWLCQEGACGVILFGTFEMIR